MERDVWEEMRERLLFLKYFFLRCYLPSSLHEAQSKTLHCLYLDLIVKRYTELIFNTREGSPGNEVYLEVKGQSVNVHAFKSDDVALVSIDLKNKPKQAAKV